MTLLFISNNSEGLGLAMRCASEGYSTSFYVEDEGSKDVGRGIVDKSIFSKHLLTHDGSCIDSNVNQLIALEKPDIVIFTSSNLGKVADYLREQGILVFGGGYWADTLSNGNGYTRKILKRVGIYSSGIDVGVIVNCGAWWNGFHFSSPYITFNETRFLTGSLGTIVKSAGVVSHHISYDTKMFEESIGKMERLLKKTRFRGNISVLCVATKDKLFGITFTTSTLFFPSLLEVYKGSVTELLSAIASGQEPKGEFTTDYTLSIPITIPPYPIQNLPIVQTIEIGGVCPSNLRHLYLKDVEKEGETYTSVGDELMVVSARGRDVLEAKKRAYKTISNLSIPNVQYRIDVGEQAMGSENALKRWGYLS